MGAAEFRDIVYIADGRKAFEGVREQEQYDRGRGGYSGTIAEKGDFQVVADAPMHPQAASMLAAKMMEEEPHDKWGPAWAIPLATGTRTETVEGFEYDSSQDLKEVVAPLLKLARGESVQQARLGFRRQSPGAGRVYSDCVAEVTIDQGLTRTVDVEVSIPAGPDTAEGLHDSKFAQAAQDAARAKVRLRKGEKFLFGSVTDRRPTYGAVQASATKGKAVTRYLVHGVRNQRVATWQGGFDTQAQARAWAIEAVQEGRAFSGPVTVTAQTRRDGGQALVSIDRPLRKVDATVRVTVATAKPQPSTPDAWMFFGFASS